MKNVDTLIESAAELAERGLSKGEIADELNVSRETASWLVERSGTTSEPEPRITEATSPQDIHVDWKDIGRDSNRLTHVSQAMADIISKEGKNVRLTVGIEKAGVPLATIVARELDTDLSAYAPAKHQWDEGDIDDLGGGFSRNFSPINDQECYIVDDTITSGTTLRETIKAIRARGGEPVGCVVLVDKQGLEEIDGVPVYSLINVVSVGREE
ncbi:orotate phosphoribosyltransferase [Halohasta litchfieldiae]|jgi:orotate phosphoribosyltransferase|uniref:Transcriptional regulator GfcR n=1 Tax=Halohasta litchfieldiae TaxID=1073996 RepID=A0A1H6TSD6_9EURY|nr:transcriptional regulator GfcR [Halohasta litchfieldiae]ATW87213.1 orotate phosphoribosyltransferase [Halohasta litchfieldiae]SEI82979.1 orotate phosphoribosyltransferase [Halohasta litchfieldiae]